VPQSLDVEVRGEIAEQDVRVLELAALRGIFADVVEEQVTYVNAPVLAKERGVETRLVTSSDSPDFRNLITLRGTLADGTQTSVSGTLTGPRQVEKIVNVDGLDVEVALSEHLAFLRYEDRPGVVGTIGRVLGEAGVNIAGMQVSRGSKGGDALVALTVDSAVPADTLEAIVQEIGAVSGRTVDLEA